MFIVGGIATFLPQAYDPDIMAFITAFLQHPVTIGTLSGLSFGLIVSLIVLIKTRIFKAELEHEIADARYDYRRLEEQLNTQMRISSKAQEELHQTIRDQQQKLEHLQENLKALQQKPGRKELRELHRYEVAVASMLEKTPGSALAWESALKSADAYLLEADRGLKPMFRKIFSPEQKTDDQGKKGSSS